MVLVTQQGVIRDFLSRSVVPTRRGYRKVEAKPHKVVPTLTTRLHFARHGRRTLKLSGPLGVRTISPARAMILLAVWAGRGQVY